METHLEETKAALRTKKMEGRAAMLTIRSMFRGEPSLNEVDKRIVAVKEEISRFENLEDRCRKCKKQPNYPPQHVRQYIQGKCKDL